MNLTFGEKVKKARTALNLSQVELAKKIGISERTIYTYEQLGIKPRMSNVVKLAKGLNVSVAYLTNDEETDPQSHMDADPFVSQAASEYGAKGAEEMQELLGRTKALFAGGTLDEETKDVFFQTLAEVYFESKAEARAKFTPKKYRKQPGEGKK